MRNASFKLHLWAEDNLEVHLSVVADHVSWATVRHLVRVSPALRRVTVAGVADLAGAVAAANAILQDRVHGNANIALAAFHDREVVSRALEAIVLAVAKFEEGLFGPLAASAPFGVTRKTHADAVVGSCNGLCLVRPNADRVASLEHLEAASDFVNAELLGGRAVVADLDVESIGTAGGRAALDEVGVDWFGCCRQGEQGAEEEACGVHFCCNECGSIAVD